MEKVDLWNLEGRKDGDRTFQMVVSARPMSQKQESVGQMHTTPSNHSILSCLACLPGLCGLLIDVSALSFPSVDPSYPPLLSLS